MMEEHKLCYLRLVLQQNNENLAKYVSAMRLLEEEARKCYAEPVELGSDEFVEMLILDSCFVVELMRKYEMGNLMTLSSAAKFFPGAFLVKSVFSQALGESDSSIKHLLELVHEGVLPLHLRQRSNVEAAEMKEFLYMPCASKLAEAGVKFEKLAEGNLFDITFKNGVMSIPPLRIENRTESVFRNLIAFEQYSDDNCYKIVTEYASFMDRLIDTPKDVEILSTRGIVDNWLGDDEVISNMFNKMVLSTVSSKHFIYDDVCNQEVNIYIVTGE
ncbi:hypothetical protein Leryth_002162 [Lithospermum erythrorhizon]|nr:hypothetical protein Leryth_002162 [Lithospermum erythrorhizon]